MSLFQLWGFTTALSAVSNPLMQQFCFVVAFLMCCLIGISWNFYSQTVSTYTVIAVQQLDKKADMKVERHRRIEFGKLHKIHNCEAVIKGDNSAIMKAQRYFRLRKPEKLLKLNCSDIFYSEYPNSQMEMNFPIAYSILTYRNFNQLSRLIRSIYRSWNQYCIHVDLKSSEDFYNLVSNYASCKHNILIAKQRIDVQWGELSVLSAAHSCFADLIESKLPWSYVINIASSDFPLKTNREIVNQLKSIQPLSNLEILDSTNFTWRYQYKFENGVSWATVASIMRSNMTKPPLKSPPPFNVTVYKGSFSAALHRDFVKLMLTNTDAQLLYEWFNDTYIPDEMYWATLYRWAYPTVIMPNFTVRYTHWGDLNPICQGYYEHGLCVFGTGDLHFIIQQPQLFAHKFDVNIEPAALDCMEEIVFNRTYDDMLIYA